MCIGMVRNRNAAEHEKKSAQVVPFLGQVQVLNGCGAHGAADEMTDFLRANHFDVKFAGNAANWNFPFTLVISRTPDMTIARKIARALKTDHCLLIRNNDRTYDATVVIGPDYGERIK